MVTLENLLIIQVILMTILVVRSFINSFATEKGKNLATKQDIQTITHKIEEAKIFYNTKLETVKTSLQINAYQQNKITEKSLDSLLAFYETSLVLIKDNLSRNFGDFAGKNKPEVLFEFQKSADDLFVTQNILYHKVVVFLGTEKEIIAKAIKIGEVSKEVRKIFKRHFGFIKMALIREDEALQISEEAYRNAVENTNASTKAYFTEANPHLSELNTNLGSFIEVLIAYLNKRDLA